MAVQKLSAIANRFLPTNMRTLYRAGLVDSNMELTTRGVSELEAIVLETHLDKLVSVAEKILDKRAKAKKK